MGEHGEHGQRSKIESQLQQLGVLAPISIYAGARVLVNPIDIFRCYLTDILAGLLHGVGSQTIYDSIQYTNSLSHGDLVLVVPRLRLKGIKPADISHDLCLQVKALPVPVECTWLTGTSVSPSSSIQSAHCLGNSPSNILRPGTSAPTSSTLRARPDSIVWP